MTIGARPELLQSTNPIAMNKLTILAASIVLSATAHAAPPSRESVDALLAAMQADRLIESTLANVEQVMRQSMAGALRGQPMSAEQQRVLDAAPAKFTRVLKDELSWERMHPFYVQIYEESFTQEDIDGLLAFYRSPTGEAFVKKMPLAQQKSMALMQSRMGPMVEKMKAAMQEAIEEAKAAK